MKIGVLGSGMVGQAIAGKLAEVGHQVMVGTRDPQKLQEWKEQAGANASTGSFLEAAEYGEVVFNAISGAGTLEALGMTEDKLNGKILIDISNPLDFSQGMPPSLFVSNTDSLGEQIQRKFPQVKVVKALNTLSNPLMINPGQLNDGNHSLFICGNDAVAKADVTKGLQDWFGWKSESIIDVGDITSARGTESLLPLWVRLWGVLGTPMFNFHIVKQ